MKWTRVILCFFIAFTIIMADAVLKAYVHYCIPPTHLSFAGYPFGGIAVLRDWYGIDFAITHVVNRGAAWGVFASFQQYLLYARILIIGGLLSYLIFAKASGFRKWCMLIIASGAMGNVLDTFIYGHVVDMFYFILWGYSNPVFNLADIVIFIGVVLLLSETLIYKFKESKSLKKNVRRST